MNRVPTVSPKTLIKVLKSIGFEPARQTGSHLMLVHPTKGTKIPVPIHPRDMKRGLFFSILKRAGISHADFLELL